MIHHVHFIKSFLHCYLVHILKSQGTITNLTQGFFSRNTSPSSALQTEDLMVLDQAYFSSVKPLLLHDIDFNIETGPP